MDALMEAVKAGAELAGVLLALAGGIGAYFVTRSQVTAHAKRIDELSNRQDLADEKRERLREDMLANYVRTEYLDKIETKLSDRMRDLEAIVRSTGAETMALLRDLRRDGIPRRE